MILARPYIYYGLLVAIAINICIAAFSRAEIAYGSFAPIAQFGIGVFLALYALQRWRPDHATRPLLVRPVALLLEAIVMIILLIFALRVMDHITKIFAPPYVDHWLNAADMALGIDWKAYFKWIHDRPDLHPVLSLCYGNIELVTAQVVTGLVLLGRLDRARFLIESVVLCSALSLLFGAFLPARGAVDFWIQNPAQYPNFATLPGVYYIQALEYVRQAGPVVIGDRGSLPGLVTFPSLHTAIGVLIVGACWRSLLALPALAYSALMIPATPVWGGHFFIDVICGAATAVAVMLLLARTAEFKGLFRAPRPRPGIGAQSDGAAAAE
jgi:hypothetical protein